MKSVDVVIVGAGPAGTAAAITLARSGREVVVFDKAIFPRDKTCGDGLTAGALRELEALGLAPHAVPSWQPIDDVVVHSPAQRTVVFPLPRGSGHYAVVARRMDLDNALVDLTRKHGATVVENTPFESVVSFDDHVEVHSGGHEPVAARYVIGADGMWSPLRKSLEIGDGSYLGEWHAFRQYFHSVHTAAGRDLHVWFEPDLLPGYAWSFPLPDGRANVGFGIQRGGNISTRSMKQLWPELLQRPHIRAVIGDDAEAESPHRAWPIPARIGRSVLSHGRALFVGDAAAATDPMTGEGIGQALLTGRLAAQAIVSGGAVDDFSTRTNYESMIASHLVADDAMSQRLLAVLARRRGAEAAVRVAGATAWSRRNFARWLFEDYPRAIAVTPRRWRRGILTGPGAYREN